MRGSWSSRRRSCSLRRKRVRLKAGGQPAKTAVQSHQTVTFPTADDAGEKIRKKWAELARELAKLAKLKPQLMTPNQAGSSLLASTITF